jgi:hypothetical protein
MGMDSEGTISDDDMNWSGRVCWLSLIMIRTEAYSVSRILSFLLGLFTGFLYYCVSTLRGYPCFVHTKGMRRWI